MAILKIRHSDFKKREGGVSWSPEFFFYYLLDACVPTLSNIPIPITRTPVSAISSVSMRLSDLI